MISCVCVLFNLKQQITTHASISLPFMRLAAEKLMSFCGYDPGRFCFFNTNDPSSDKKDLATNLVGATHSLSIGFGFCPALQLGPLWHWP